MIQRQVQDRGANVTNGHIGIASCQRRRDGQRNLVVLHQIIAVDPVEFLAGDYRFGIWFNDTDFGGGQCCGQRKPQDKGDTAR